MWISVGKSKNDTRWQLRQYNWPDLVKRLKEAKTTSETIAQYSKLTKEERDEIKDIGGFVGGTIKGGRRLASAIECRTLLTLDADFEADDLWEMFSLLYDCAAFVHATHSSTTDKLRLRVIIPLSRECFTDEYEALARKVADNIGMNYFDATTFQAERLMFWPSVSKNATYFFREQVGPPLDVDEILNEYLDWHDMSQWPLHDKEKEKIKTGISKQENPLEKPGLIGAFCRTYTIHDVIDSYLKDVYEPTDLPDRFTYKQGSTSGGLVTYENMFAYSHHNTDACSGQLCNAFDLVRLSLFSDSDEIAAVNTPVHKLPSFIRCTELILKDSKVKKALVNDKYKEAQSDFAEFKTQIENNEQAENNEDWKDKLDVDKKGNCYSTTNNIVLILQNDEKFKNIFRWDSFNHRIIVTTNTYWKKINTVSDTWVNDNDTANMRHYLETFYNISGKDKIKDALLITANASSFNPVLDYLKGLEWDGVDRLNSLLIDYLGAEDNEYTRTVTRKTFVAAIARIFEPGIKFDTMLILVGKQGTGKSTLLFKMAGKWFSDNVGNLHDKSSIEQLRGVWLMEIGELASLKKADIDTIKSYISRTEDRFRQAFGENLSSFPRQCIFIGTTNEDEPLIDSTGNRRFWPVVLNVAKHKKSVFGMDEKTRGQLWAEALYYYQQGETLYLDRHINEMAEKVQELHTEKESYFDAIEMYLDKSISTDWNELSYYDRVAYLNGDKSVSNGTETTRYKVTPLDIWLEALNGKKDAFDKFKAKAVKNSMRRVKGWDYRVIKIDGILTRGWYRMSANEMLNGDNSGRKNS